VANDIGRVEADDLRLTSGGLAVMANTGAVFEGIKTDLGYLLLDKIKAADGWDGTIVEPEKMWGVKVVLDNVLPVDIIVKDGITGVRRL